MDMAHMVHLLKDHIIAVIRLFAFRPTKQMVQTSLDVSEVVGNRLGFS